MKSLSFRFRIPGITTTANAKTSPATSEQRSVAVVSTIMKICTIQLSFLMSAWGESRCILTTRYILTKRVPFIMETWVLVATGEVAID
ncbi:MAG: hypothetical protein AAF664_05200 [Planctomycetota bacterium]